MISVCFLLVIMILIIGVLSNMLYPRSNEFHRWV